MCVPVSDEYTAYCAEMRALSEPDCPCQAFRAEQVLRAKYESLYQSFLTENERLRQLLRAHDSA